MIERYLNSKKTQYQILENSDFIKTLRIEGNVKNLFHLDGFHKLIRVSPFGKNGKLHTSLCKVSVSKVNKKSKYIISENDIRMDFFKSTGPGGQHRNKTMSAVRLVHLPTNIIVTSSAERSQHDNRKYAYEQLQLKIEEMLDNKDKDNKSESYKNKLLDKDVALSYNLHTNIVSCSNSNQKNTLVKEILDGKLDLII